MVATSTSVKVTNRISKIFQVTASSLNGTPIPEAVLTYLKIPEPSRTDLNNLRVILNVYKDSLSTNKVRVYDAVNKILQVVENEFIFEQVGSTVLNESLNKEHTNGLTLTKIKEAISSAISENTIVEDYAFAIASTIGGVKATETTNLAAVLTTAMNAGIAGDDIEVAVSALTTALSEAENTADGIADAVYDGIYILDSNPGDSTDKNALSAEITSYSNSDLFVTTTSAIGEGDISLVSDSDDNSLIGVIGNINISSIGSSLSSAIGSPTTGLLGNSGTTITAAIGETALTSVTPLGATAATTLSGAVDLLSSKVGLSSLAAAGLRGADSASPATVKIAIDNIDAAIGDGQLLENTASSGTISGVIGTISTGLLGVESTSIASAIGNVDISLFGSSLSEALVNTVGNISIDNFGTSTLSGAIGVGGLLGGTPSITAAIGTSSISNVGSSIASAIGSPTTGLLGSSGTTITAAIGETALTSVTPLGATAATTLSGAVDLLSSKVGSAQIAPTNALTVNQCSYDGESYALGDVIYTTENKVADTIKGIVACGKWTDTGEDLYFSHTGLVGDCSDLLDPGQALAKCLHYLDVNP